MAIYVKRPTGGAIYLVWNHTARHVRAPGKLLNPSQAVLSQRRLPAAVEGCSRLVISTDGRLDEYLNLAAKQAVLMAEVVTDDVLHIPFNTRTYPLRVLWEADIASLQTKRAAEAAGGVDEKAPAKEKKAKPSANPNAADVPVKEKKAKPPQANPNAFNAPEAVDPGPHSFEPGLTTDDCGKPAGEHEALQPRELPVEETPVVEDETPDPPTADEEPAGPPTADDDGPPTVDDEPTTEPTEPPATNPTPDPTESPAGDAVTVVDQEVYDSIPWDTLADEKRNDLRKYGKAFAPPVKGSKTSDLVEGLQAAYDAVNS